MKIVRASVILPPSCRSHVASGMDGGLNLGRSSAAFAGRPHHSTRIKADLILHDEHGEVDRTLQQSPCSKWLKGKREEKSRSGANGSLGTLSPGVWILFGVDMPVITRPLSSRARAFEIRG